MSVFCAHRLAKLSVIGEAVERHAMSVSNLLQLGRICQVQIHYDLRKYNFTNRVIPIWNSLPNHVVSAETVNTFKPRLDKFWIDQDVMYNYKADLHGIGNRSIIV